MSTSDAAPTAVRTLKRVCVFCGSAAGTHPDFMAAARALGDEMARRGIELVYGGGSVGLMGEVARTVDSHGIKVNGVIPKALMTRELSGQAIGELTLTDSMHARKELMASLSDAFIALPGGYGTLEELLEMLTWLQLGVHSKPVAVLNIRGYYDSLNALLKTANTSGFISDRYSTLLLSESDPVALLDTLERVSLPDGVTKWINMTQS